MTDDTPRDYTIYVEYDARIMWRDDNDKTGQIGPTFHSHDADQLVTDRLYMFRDGLAAEEFKPSEVSGRSFVVPLSDADAKRVKAGKVTITQDGAEAGSDGAVDTSPTGRQAKEEAKAKQSPPPGANKDQLAAKEAEKAHTKQSGDERPVQADDQAKARESKVAGPDPEKARRVTADR